MRIHHLNCGTMRPPARVLVNGGGGGLFARGEMCCHCLAIETPSAGIVLIDSGLGSAELREPGKRLGRGFPMLTGLVADPQHAAIHRLAALGLDARDVRHIVLTHMDIDHAGGLADFPAARVHVHAREFAAATARATFRERHRYVPAQWQHASDIRRYAPDGERWRGFEAVRQLDGLPPEILLVPLHGHTRGHTGVVVERAGETLVHAGDAYFHRDEVHAPTRRCPPALRAMQALFDVDRAQRLANQGRLRALAQTASDIRIFSAHDPVELASFAG